MVLFSASLLNIVLDLLRPFCNCTFDVIMDFVQGEANTKEFRTFVQHEGKDISAWHDIPLQNEDGSFNFVCEIPKETSAKMEVATVSSMSNTYCIRL